MLHPNANERCSSGDVMQSIERILQTKNSPSVVQWQQQNQSFNSVFNSNFKIQDFNQKQNFPHSLTWQQQQFQQQQYKQFIENSLNQKFQQAEQSLMEKLEQKFYSLFEENNKQITENIQSVTELFQKIHIENQNQLEDMKSQLINQGPFIKSSIIKEIAEQFKLYKQENEDKDKKEQFQVQELIKQQIEGLQYELKELTKQVQSFDQQLIQKYIPNNIPLNQNFMNEENKNEIIKTIDELKTKFLQTEEKYNQQIISFQNQLGLVFSEIYEFKNQNQNQYQQKSGIYNVINEEKMNQQSQILFGQLTSIKVKMQLFKNESKFLQSQSNEKNKKLKFQLHKAEQIISKILRTLQKDKNYKDLNNIIESYYQFKTDERISYIQFSNNNRIRYIELLKKLLSEKKII